MLLQIAVPTRTEVPEYQKLRAVAHRLVGRINGRFGSPTYNPIQYLDQSAGFEELVALYHVADACVVTSLRDGMNLVSYEYVACQAEGDTGVLILTEFAGAAQTLGAGCVRVNPLTRGARRGTTGDQMGEEQRRAAPMRTVRRQVHFTAVGAGLHRQPGRTGLDDLSPAAPALPLPRRM